MSRETLQAILVTATLATAGSALADETPAPPAVVPKVPLSITAATRTREGLVPLDPWPRDMVIRGAESHSSRDLYSGEFVVQIYEGADGIVRVTDYPYDEFVHVLHGEAILTPEGGVPQHYGKGDFFIVPRGFTGTWEGRNGFRELIVMETKAHTAAWTPMLEGTAVPKKD